MQADPPSSKPPELSVKVSEDLGSKSKMGGSDEEEERQELGKSVETDGKSDKEEEEEEFSFAFVNTEESPVTAEEAFQDGLIRPVYPLFDRNLLFRHETECHQDDYVLLSDSGRVDLPPPARKVFVEDQVVRYGDNDDSTADSSEPQGPFCAWSGKTVAEASPESCRRLWRFRDILLRSNSHGKHAFVFINNDTAAATEKQSRGKEKEKEKKKKTKEETAAALEKLYVRNRASREEAKRRSYLPYKKVGFFADVHGLTRNIHPF
ncbi:PREDICTED: uncharacterized protein LOC104824695 [Tarenaya hassleriana]|uniref:uncharacterized protein LOC104824695 n=1 Tax=Tarenaya hassleriana TaxID=28532 RepID=UPI00053C8D4E|nr:PREDICTED: uncharacterized protein LOC104824695 [Tarenaya hassleriana]